MNVFPRVDRAASRPGRWPTRKDCYLTAHLYRRASPHGLKKAIVATAHQIPSFAFHLPRDRAVYRDEAVLKPRPEPPEPATLRRTGGRRKCAERGVDRKR